MRKIILMLMMTLMCIGFVSAFSGGTGTEGDPYLISSCLDLDDIRTALSSYYELTGDIDCSDTINWDAGSGWDPISVYRGKLEGNDYTVSDLYINQAVSSEAGFIAEMNTGGTIYNINFENISNYASSNGQSGLLVGHFLNGYVENVTLSGYIEDDSFPNGCGGFAGYANGLGSNLVKNMLINVTINCYASYTGGFAGWIVADQKVDQVGVNVIIHNEGLFNSDRIGGFAGRAGDDYIINNSYAEGSITGVSGFTFYRAAFIGEHFSVNGAILQNSYSNVNLTVDFPGGTKCGFACGVPNSYSNNYWNYEAASFASTVGSLETAANMKKEATFVGLDFSNIWTISEDEDTPRFQWEPVDCTPEWSCSEYGDCIPNKFCIAAEDLNSCGEVYTGDLSEFEQISCSPITWPSEPTEPELPDEPEKEEEQPPLFVIAPIDEGIDFKLIFEKIISYPLILVKKVQESLPKYWWLVIVVAAALFYFAKGENKPNRKNRGRK